MSSVRFVTVYDVNEGGAGARQVGEDALVGDRQSGFVVESRIAFVAVEHLLVFLGHRPHRNGDAVAFGGFYREIRSGLTALEEQSVVLYHRSAERLRAGAADTHLIAVEVAAVGEVIFCVH